MNSGLKRLAWILNTIGLIIYVAWLYTMQDQDILRSQDGVLYFIPCVPFFFVYMLLIPPKPQPAKEKEQKETTDKPSEEPPPPPER